MPARKVKTEVEEDGKPAIKKHRRKHKPHQNGKDNAPKKEKAARKESEADLPPHVRPSGSGLSIVNPASYQRLAARLEESANCLKDGGRPESGTLVESPWACALCRRLTCRDGLGDLFGPLPLPLDPPALWPPSLPPPPKKKRKDDVFTELWLHGDCAVWAPGLLLKGPRLVGLHEHLPDFWAQACAFCGEVGAAVACSVSGCPKLFHFPCGVQKKCTFHEESLAAWCDKHAHLGRKKNHSAA